MKSLLFLNLKFGFHFLQVLDTRTEDLTEEVIKDRAYGILFARKFDEELENTLRQQELRHL